VLTAVVVLNCFLSSRHRESPRRPEGCLSTEVTHDWVRHDSSLRYASPRMTVVSRLCFNAVLRIFAFFSRSETLFRR
jgi:hypothetical protein